MRTSKPSTRTREPKGTTGTKTSRSKARQPKPKTVDAQPGRSALHIPSNSQPAKRIFVGTSGWAYSTWKPGFYPAQVSAKNFLTYYSSRLNSVEVNYTFRQLPTAGVVANWLAGTSAEFRFSFKAPQRITHFQRLRECEALTAEFVHSLDAVRESERLGLLLFQLPPNFKADLARLRDFLEIPTLRGPHATPIAFEFRHTSWFTEELYTLLSDANAALCVADHGDDADELKTPGIHPASTYASLRLRRSGGYTASEIERFAEQAVELAASRDVYIYLRHEEEPTGALNASALLERAVAR